MKYNIEQYEYKAPSYELKHRPDPDIDYLSHRSKRRFFRDLREGIFKSAAGEKDRISLLFGGDLLCQEYILNRHTKKTGGYDFALCFEYIKPLLQSADFAAGNLETPIAHTAPYRGDILSHEGPYFCNAPIEYLEALSDVGFDMLTTENNHTLDAGARGAAETIVNTERFGFIQTGTFAADTEKFVVVDICGFKVGFTAFGAGAYNTMQQNLSAEGRDILLNTYSPEHAKAILAAMKARGAEYTVCFPHWGKEYTETLNQKQLDVSKQLTKYGYDLVVGAHAHVIQKFALVNKAPVIYSLGSLISHLNVVGKKGIEYTVLCHLTLERKDGQIVPDVGFIPCKVMKNYKGIPFCVVPVADTLGLSEDKRKRLVGTTQRVHDRLGCKSSRLHTAYPVTAEAAAAFRKMEAGLSERLEALLEPVQTEVAMPTVELPADSDRHILERNCLYRLYPDHAELLEMGNFASVVVLPTTVEKSTVTVLRGSGKPNPSTRLLYLGKQVETVADGAFENYTNVESFRLYSHLKTIGKRAFAGCTGMTGVILPASMRTVDSEAFAGCTSLLTAKIPAGVTSIAPDAFRGCPKLTIYCEPDTEADRFARSQGIPVRYMPLDADSPLNRMSPAEINAAAPAQAAPVSAPAPAVTAAPAPVAPAAPVSAAQPAAQLPGKLPMGPRNGPEDKHPKPIIAACYYLGKPLPKSAVCGKQPSHYIGRRAFDGTLAAVVKALGDRMPVLKETDDLEKMFRRFRFKYKNVTVPTFNGTDLCVYFTDWLLFAREQGFSHDDYFDYELYNKEPEIRATFLSEEYRLHIWRLCVPKDYRNHFAIKPRFNARFREFIGRDFCNAKNVDFETFKAFVDKHPTFFAKPLAKTGGSGARVLSTRDASVEELYETCRSEVLLAEEILEQHASLAEFNESTLNTVRVVTMIGTDNVPRILWAFSRFGRAGNCADNFHSGGVCAIMDAESGVVVSDALNRSHSFVTHHPDSNLPICGFQYPYWDAVKDLVLRAAMVVPQVRHVGWDVAITKDGTPKIVEGNTRSGFASLQASTQTGCKHLYARHVAELEAATGFPPYVEKPLPDIDITGMERDK